MRQNAPLMNRRTRQRLFAGWAGLSLALWLVMAVAEIWTPLHAWMHGGAIPENDDCAIVALAHGNVDSVAAPVLAPTPTVWIEVTSQFVFSVHSTIIEQLPAGRAPPVLPSVS
jgi:hypothetical protein